ncbi:hypothetical protein B0A55_12606, partial [Friedmanniomyces simplex]
MNINTNPPPGLAPQAIAYRGTSTSSKHHAIQDELTRMQAERAPLGLTLGVELECILAHCTYPSNSTTCGQFVRGSRLGKDTVAEALSQPIQATCSTCGARHWFDLPVKVTACSVTGDAYTEWHVADDSSIELTEAEKAPLANSLRYFDFYSIEIRTRIMKADQAKQTTPSKSQPGHTHTIAYAEEVRAVLAHLNQTFNTPPPPGQCPPFRLLVNNSCGMHVHLGNETHAGFPLRTLKNLLSTYYACEAAIDALHAVDRIGGSGIACLPTNQTY